MDLNIFAYGGIGILIILLVIFELKERGFGKRMPQGGGYDYYTPDNSRVRINKVFPSLYKIYVYSNSPVSTKRDRFGYYFTVKARSASEAEYLVDAIYQQEG